MGSLIPEVGVGESLHSLPLFHAKIPYGSGSHFLKRNIILIIRRLLWVRTVAITVNVCATPQQIAKPAKLLISRELYSSSLRLTT